jgi:hypothetical protein
MGHWYDIFTGGMGKSTNPSDYQTPVRQQGLIDQTIAKGLGTNRTAPQTAVGGQFRDAQIGQLGQLQGLASGQQKTAGELAAYRAAQQAGAQQQAMARMARGGDAVLAQRTAANNMAGISSNAAGQVQRSALEGQMAAQGLLTQAAGQGRGQDSQIQLANMDAQLKQMGMDDQTRLGYLSQMTGLSIAQLQAQIAAMNGATQQQGLLGPLLSAGGQVGAAAVPLMMASDERAKTEISDARHEVDEMLEALMPKAYVYKDQSKHGVGRRVGIMAQDMAKTTAGRHVVIDDIGDGVMGLDTNKAISAALASAARLHERVRDLEAQAEK